MNHLFIDKYASKASCGVPTLQGISLPVTASQILVYEVCLIKENPSYFVDQSTIK